jgi:hypothetical protein
MTELDDEVIPARADEALQRRDRRHHATAFVAGKGGLGCARAASNLGLGEPRLASGTSKERR